MDVSNRRLQAQLTRQAKIPSALLLSEGIFVFAGFVSRLKGSKEYPTIKSTKQQLQCFNVNDRTGICGINHNQRRPVLFIHLRLKISHRLKRHLIQHARFQSVGRQKTEAI